MNLMKMSEFGINSEGGIDRALGSEADYEVREWIKEYWETKLGLEVRTDQIANIWAIRDGNEELLPIVTGSHHDAVPNGGKYDGAMGVAIATEVMQTIIESNIQLRHPLHLISFTGEEPNPFNVSTLGSKVISGRLHKKDLENVCHRGNGQKLSQCIEHLSGNLDDVDGAEIPKGKLAAFLEVHNELGGYLESQGASVSAVKAITGIYREKITAYGEANHAGTTLMNQRKDAFLGMAELATKIDEIAKSFNDPNVVETMGYIKISPNEANVIPYKSESLVDIRTFDNDKKNQLLASIDEAVIEIEASRGVVFKREVILDQPPRELDKEIEEIVMDEIEKTGEKKLSIVSMAGHDAANMQLVTKSGMIFVRSIGGKGHCKEEYSKKEDICKAAQLALEVILKLDGELAV